MLKYTECIHHKVLNITTENNSDRDTVVSGQVIMSSAQRSATQTAGHIVVKKIQNLNVIKSRNKREGFGQGLQFIESS